VPRKVPSRLQLGQKQKEATGNSQQRVAIVAN